MTNEIKPERIEELLRELEPPISGTHKPVAYWELRTLLRCYQRVRGLPGILRGAAAICRDKDFGPNEQMARGLEKAADAADRAIRGEEGHE